MIFNLFKSKPTLKELIPNGFIDIHSHILPAIDDGAQDVKQSIKLISKMRKLGFAKIIGTPHTYPGLYENTTESIRDSFNLIENEKLKDIKIGYASEYMLDNSLINKARNKELLCLKENYILVEMSFISEIIGLFEILYEIKANGYIPILAHPERYLYLNYKKIIKLKKFGCLLQANLLSFTDYYGVSVRKNLEKIIEKDLIDFAGSDIHNLHHVSAFDLKVNNRRVDLVNKIIENNNYFV